MRYGLEAGVQAGEGPGEAADLVAHHPMAVLFVALEVLVGVDDHLRDLGREALEYPFDHRPAAQRLEPFVHATHASALAAREHDSRNGAHRGGFYSVSFGR